MRRRIAEPPARRVLRRFLPRPGGRGDTASSGDRASVAAVAGTAGLLRLIDARGVADVPIPEIHDATPAGVLEAVREIIEEVRRDGDAALRQMARRFDGASLSDLAVAPGACAAALAVSGARRA